MPDRFYGWLKDPFDPVAVYHYPKAVKIPDVVDLSAFSPPVRDQGQVGSCTGFGIGGMAGNVSAQLKIFKEWWSPNWLYNGARYIEGTLNQDVGANPDDVFDWAVGNGLLWEEYWPYTGKLDQNAPSSTREGQAIQYPNITKVRVDDGVAGILSALADGHAVAIGGPFPQEWEAGSLDVLPIPKVSSQIAGGHEMFVDGYNNPSGYVTDQNSWGAGWSNKGRCKIPFEYYDWAKNNGGYDAHYLAWDPLPIPPNPPKPFCAWFKQHQKESKKYKCKGVPESN